MALQKCSVVISWLFKPKNKTVQGGILPPGKVRCELKKFVTAGRKFGRKNRVDADSFCSSRDKA